MSLLPLDPSLARALLAARDLKCLEQVRPAVCKSSHPSQLGPWLLASLVKQATSASRAQPHAAGLPCRLQDLPVHAPGIVYRPTKPWPAPGCVFPTHGLPALIALPQMMTVASMLSPESSVFLGGKGPEQLAAGTDQQGGNRWLECAGAAQCCHALQSLAFARNRQTACCWEPGARHFMLAPHVPLLHKQTLPRRCCFSPARRPAGRARRRGRAVHKRTGPRAAEGAAKGGAGGPYPAAAPVRGELPPSSWPGQGKLALAVLNQTWCLQPRGVWQASTRHMQHMCWAPADLPGRAHVLLLCCLP